VLVRVPDYTVHRTLSLPPVEQSSPILPRIYTDGQQDTEPAQLSTLLTQLLLPTLQLHLLPKSSLDVYLLILESDTMAGVLSAGLTVAGAAVADAGIGMWGLGVGGVVVCRLSS
jgi:ribonuclease PH